MLGDGYCPKGAIKSPSCGRDSRLLHKKVEVHFPNPRHFVQQDKSTFEQGVGFCVFSMVNCWIPCSQVPYSEVEILRTRQHAGLNFTSEGHLQGAIACKSEVDVCRHAPIPKHISFGV